MFTELRWRNLMNCKTNLPPSLPLLHILHSFTLEVKETLQTRRVDCHTAFNILKRNKRLEKPSYMLASILFKMFRPFFPPNRLLPYPIPSLSCGRKAGLQAIPKDVDFRIRSYPPPFPTLHTYSLPSRTT